MPGPCTEYTERVDTSRLDHACIIPGEILAILLCCSVPIRFTPATGRNRSPARGAGSRAAALSSPSAPGQFGEFSLGQFPFSPRPGALVRCAGVDGVAGWAGIQSGHAFWSSAAEWLWPVSLVLQRTSCPPPPPHGPQCSASHTPKLDKVGVPRLTKESPPERGNTSTLTHNASDTPARSTAYSSAPGHSHAPKRSGTDAPARGSLTAPFLAREPSRRARLRVPADGRSLGFSP
eukprot:gene14332-biopygen8717